MTVEHVEFLVEERSMEAALRGFLPTILGALSFEVHPFNGKLDLIRKLPARLSAYSSWITDSTRIFVVVDRDDDDCQCLKQNLEASARNANLVTRSGANGGHFAVVNRLVIEELEAWYFGDWEAVRAVYPRVSENVPRRARFRDPDAIQGGTWEAFEQILQTAGYFRGGLPKIQVAAEIAPHLDPQRSGSRSFRIFCSALDECLSTD